MYRNQREADAEAAVRTANIGIEPISIHTRGMRKLRRIGSFTEARVSTRVTKNSPITSTQI
jgi:hypothetical protein